MKTPSLKVLIVFYLLPSTLQTEVDHLK